MTSDAGLRHSAFGLGLTVFTAGACMMCVEIVGGLTVAPYFGSNVFVWGSVIGVFMAALSAGYVIGGRVADRRPSPVILSVLMILAGLFVLAIPLCGAAVNRAILAIRMPPALRPLMPLASVALLYFVPSMLLGMISPIAVRIASTALASVGRVVGRLYALNTLGSFAGALAGTFLLVVFFGNRAILIGNGAALLVAGVTGLLLERRLSIESVVPPRVKNAANPVPGLRPLVFVCGMVLMSLEVIGGAEIAPYFGSNVFVWGSVITVFLGAMTAGYRLGGRVADFDPDIRTLAKVVGAAGILTLLVPLLGPPVCRGLLSVSLGGNLNVLRPLLAAAVLYFLPTMLFAMVAPFAVRISASRVENIGGVAGRLYALSTLGNVVGVLLTTFVLISAFGKTRLFETAGVATVLAGVAAAMVYSRAVKAPQPKTAPALFIVAAVVLALAGKPELVSVTDQFERVLGMQGEWKLVQVGDDAEYLLLRRLLAQRESPYHHIAVIDEIGVPTGVRIKTDGGKEFVAKNTILSERARRELRFDQYIESSVLLNPDASALREPYTSGTTYGDMLHLPFIFKPDIRDVLIIGGGGGVVPMIFRHAYDVDTDVVEIDPVVVEVAEKWFGLAPDERLRVHIEDGRMFVRNTDRLYDLIILDAYTAGGRIPAHLTTREFIEEVRSKLRPDGVVLMNVINSVEGRKSKLFRAELKTFRKVFGAESIYAFPKFLGKTDYEMSTNIMLIATGTAHTQRLSQHEISSIANRLTLSRFVPVHTLSSHASNMLSDGQLSHIPQDDVPVLTDDFAPVDIMTLPLTH